MESGEVVRSQCACSKRMNRVMGNGMDQQLFLGMCIDDVPSPGVVEK
jgi:hypothetical protein